MTFGEKLKYYRKKAGLTQTELAEAADLSLNTISNYEKGNTYPKDRKTYETLAKVLGVDPDELKSEGRKYAIGIDINKMLAMSPFGKSFKVSDFISSELVWNGTEEQLSEEQIRTIENASNPPYLSYKTISEILYERYKFWVAPYAEKQLPFSKTQKSENHNTIANEGEASLSDELVSILTSFFMDSQIAGDVKDEAMFKIQEAYLKDRLRRNKPDSK